MDIAISGASGLIGSALGDSLSAGGHRVIALVRRTPAAGADEIEWQPAKGMIDHASLEGVGAVVHLAGAGIGDRRWTDSRKELLVRSRVDGTTLLATTLADLNTKPGAFVCGSGVGYYGSTADTELTETSPQGEGFLAQLVHDWESAASPASDAGIRTAFARTSVVLTETGGALKKQLLIFRLGLGGRFGSGKQWLSWISLRDEVRALEFLIHNPVAGPVNLCSPEPVTNQEFTKTLGSVLKRPTMIPIPLIGPKALFGSEMVDEVLLASQRGLPSVLLDHGFSFEDPQLRPALERMLTK